MKNTDSLRTFLSKFGFNYSIVNRLMLAAMLIAEVIAFSIFSPYFFQLDNLLPVGREIATLGIVAIGQTLCILTGGFDLSLGGSAAISGIVVGYLCAPSRLDLPYGIGFIAAIAVAVLVGVINGTLITKVKINPLIATLSMNFMLGGAVLLITRQPITVNTAAFRFIGATTFGSVRFPLPIITLAILYVGFGLILKYTVFGRQIYCTGGNVQAARIAGINVESLVFRVYILHY